MQNIFRYYFIVALLAIWPHFTGCYTYIGAEKDRLFSKEPHPKIENSKCDSEQGYFEKLICHHQTTLKEDKAFKYILAEDEDLKVEGLEDKEDALKAQLLLRFVWFSDVHMPQRELLLFSQMSSNWLVRWIHSVKHDSVQKDFHWALYLSLIEATNKLHSYFWEKEKHGIDFMIHTGDSILNGSMEELYQFIYISNQLNIPWLNLVGNHDDTIFGNFKPRLGYGRDPGVNFYPVNDLDDFLWMHRPKREIYGFGQYLLPTPTTGGHAPSEMLRNGKKFPPTCRHGFDLNPDPKGKGDYAFTLSENPIPIRLVALNTSKKDKMWAPGEIASDQRKWLEGNTLLSGEAINLVFMHHGLEDLSRWRWQDWNETRKLLRSPDDKTVVFFTGHTHEHRLIKEVDPNKGGRYELNTGSVLEFPQIGRLIELRRDTEKGNVYLISKALRSSYMKVLGEKPPKEYKEMKKALENDCGRLKDEKFIYFIWERDEQYGNKEEENKDLIEKNMLRASIMESPPKSIQCAHSGAYADYLHKKGFWSTVVSWFSSFLEQQSVEKGWETANKVILIKKGNSK